MEQTTSERQSPLVGVQVPTEAVLVSGVDATAGQIVGPITLTAAVPPHWRGRFAYLLKGANI